MPAHRALLICTLLLTACTQQGDDQPCDCLVVPSDAEAMAMMGFTEAVILTQVGSRLDDGTEMNSYQFDPTLATAQMIAASPAATCGHYDRTVISSRISDSYGDPDLKMPGSIYLVIHCSATPDPEATT